jgi:hypothetical protein
VDVHTVKRLGSRSSAVINVIAQFANEQQAAAAMSAIIKHNKRRASSAQAQVNDKWRAYVQADLPRHLRCHGVQRLPRYMVIDGPWNEVAVASAGNTPDAAKKLHSVLQQCGIAQHMVNIHTLQVSAQSTTPQRPHSTVAWIDTQTNTQQQSTQALVACLWPAQQHNTVLRLRSSLPSAFKVRGWYTLPRLQAASTHRRQHEAAAHTHLHAQPSAIQQEESAAPSAAEDARAAPEQHTSHTHIPHTPTPSVQQGNAVARTPSQPSRSSQSYAIVRTSQQATSSLLRLSASPAQTIVQLSPHIPTGKRRRTGSPADSVRVRARSAPPASPLRD